MLNKQTENELNRLFEKYVPTMGKAETEGGEILRAGARIIYRYQNDGDMIGCEYGKETCNAAARYLLKHGNDYIQQDIWDAWEAGENWREDTYKICLKALAEDILDYLTNNPAPFEKETEDMWDHYDADKDRDEYDEDEDEDGWDW